ncbi:MAG: hypothetical protein ACRDT0_10685 [Pseudonocardiaceae bacterium]
MGQLRSQKQERGHLVRSLRAAGKSWVEVAAVLRQRYRVNARVAFRYAHCWSQRQAADEWNKRWPDELKTFKNFSYWEQWPGITGHAPSFDNLSKLAELYECAVSDLLIDLPDFRHLDDPCGKIPTTRQNSTPVAIPDNSSGHVGIQWNHHSVTFVVRQITGEELSVTRREVLTAGAGASAALVGADLIEPLQQWLLPINDFAKSVTRTSDFSSTELTALEELVDQFRDWSSSGNGALARKTAIAQLNDFTDRLHSAPSGPLTSQAFRVAAELSDVVASMSWDAGLHRPAQRYYIASVQLAKLAHDDGLAAVVLGALARQCYDLGHPRDGVEIVQLAQYGCRKAATALLRSMLATREAWGYAQLGESQAFRRAVGLAEDYFAEGPSDRDHRSIRYFDAAELAGVIGGRYRDLARHEPKYARNAQEYIKRALELRDPAKLWLRAFDIIGLARTCLISADPERACELIHQAMPIVPSWANGRVGVKLREFHQEASQYVEVPTVRDTRDLIRDLARSGW